MSCRKVSVCGCKSARVRKGQRPDRSNSWTSQVPHYRAIAEVANRELPRGIPACGFNDLRISTAKRCCIRTGNPHSPLSWRIADHLGSIHPRTGRTCTVTQCQTKTDVISRTLASGAKLCGGYPPATHQHLLCYLTP